MFQTICPEPNEVPKKLNIKKRKLFLVKSHLKICDVMLILKILFSRTFLCEFFLSTTNLHFQNWYRIFESFDSHCDPFQQAQQNAPLKKGGLCTV